jgi:hypothetical protein
MALVGEWIGALSALLAFAFGVAAMGVAAAKVRHR